MASAVLPEIDSIAHSFCELHAVFQLSVNQCVAKGSAILILRAMLLLNGGQRQKSGVEGNQMFRKMDCKKKPVSYPAGFVS